MEKNKELEMLKGLIEELELKLSFFKSELDEVEQELYKKHKISKIRNKKVKGGKKK